ncbi:MAG: class I SAM-dependent methyltransferase [Spirochaetaceae bacterium]|nr:MAG: class I SAM-dependent methyltransferase [Spirochaetaceae bacterium]
MVGLWARDLEREVLRELLHSHQVPEDSVVLLDAMSEGRLTELPCDLLVLDRRTLHRSFVEELRNVCGHRPFLLGLDAVGSGAELCNYVIDGFPRLKGLRGNEQHTAFISSTAVGPPNPARNSTAPHDRPLQILVTLGASGDASREARLLRALHTSRQRPLQVHIYGIEGSAQLCDERDDMLVYRHGFDPSLAMRFSEFDIVFTHFGVTAYEAAAAGCAVVLLNPGRYHEQLSRCSGFVTLPYGCFPKLRWHRVLAKLFRNPGYVQARSAAVLNPRGRSTTEVVRDLVRYRTAHIANSPENGNLVGFAQCPVCSSNSHSLLYRFPSKNYLRCQTCGVLFMQRAIAHDIQYNTEYFFREYEKQYGKSYLQDFHHIKGMGALRVQHIRDLLHGSLLSGAAAPVEATSFSLLDIGCAYGPFMAAAQEAGAQSFGIDVAEDAVQYVVNQLGFQAACIPVQELNASRQFGQDSFHVVTMWYVIEHFERLDPVLKAVAGLVAPHGVFAFSTPNGTGISARSNHERFLRNSPEDHFTVWEAKRTAGILRRYGFRVERVVVTGHHPERFPFMGRWAGCAPVGWVLNKLSRLFGLGDTFEVYARRVE